MCPIAARPTLVTSFALFVTACGPGVEPNSGTDASASDDAGIGPGPDAGMISDTCGTGTLAPGVLSGGKEVAIGVDGDVFHLLLEGDEAFLARLPPGGVMDDDWLSLGAGVNIRDLAVAADHQLYVVREEFGGVSLGRVDPAAATPAITTIGPTLFEGGAPTSVAVSPSGEVYLGAGDGVYRSEPGTGVRIKVSSTTIVAQLLVRDEQHLLALTGDGLVEITLSTDGTEESRQTLAARMTSSFHRFGLDVLGRWYGTIRAANSGKLLRFSPDFTSDETLLSQTTGGNDYGDLVFGKGALRCDLWIAGFASDRHVEGDTPGRP